jgi:hypothetical protein
MHEMTFRFLVTGFHLFIVQFVVRLELTLLDLCELVVCEISKYVWLFRYLVFSRVHADQYVDASTKLFRRRERFMESVGPCAM